MYLNLYSNLFGWEIFPIYFHLKFNKNANNANFGSFEKPRLQNCITWFDVTLLDVKRTNSWFGNRK